MWRAGDIKPVDAKKMRDLRAEYGIEAGGDSRELPDQPVRPDRGGAGANSIAGFRGEVERALALGAEYLVLHPGSWKGLTREEGLRLSGERSSEEAQSTGKRGGALTSGDSDREHGGRGVLPGRETGAGGGAGGELKPLRAHRACVWIPATCMWRDMILCRRTATSETSEASVESTVGFDAVKVWHCNMMRGRDGIEAGPARAHRPGHDQGRRRFRRLLHDMKRFAHCAFIAETPVDSQEMRRGIKAPRDA